MKTIDACGRSCPEPVLMTREALAARPQSCEVLVDNPTAVQNVARFAAHAGYAVCQTQQGAVWRLALEKTNEA